MFDLILALDIYVYVWFLRLVADFPVLLKVFEVISFFGSYNFVLSVLFFSCIFLLEMTQDRGKKLFTKNFFPLSISILSTAAAVTLLKNIFVRVGPVTRVLYETDYSFPSAHAAVSLVIFSIVYFLINENFKLSKVSKKILFSFTVIFIFLISLSRLILGVHYLSDVVVGVFLGYLGFLVGRFVYKRFK